MIMNDEMEESERLTLDGVSIPPINPEVLEHICKFVEHVGKAKYHVSKIKEIMEEENSEEDSKESSD